MNRLAAVALVAALTYAPPTQAEPLFEVMGSYPDHPDVLLPVMDVGMGTQFDVVVLLNSEDSPSAAVEFVITELLLIAPGVFKLGSSLDHLSPLLWINDWPGEYIIAFGGCMPAGSGLELLRVTYGTFGGPVPPDTVIELRGFQPGDSFPSAFDGNPGIIDCSDNGFAGRMGGHPGGHTETGVVFPDGSLGLNLTQPVVPAEAGSWGALKSRY